MERLVPQGKTTDELLGGARKWLERSENPLATPPSRPRSDSCPECGGTGWREIRRDGVCRVTTCGCVIERDRQRKIEAIPPRFRWARLEDLEPHPDPEQWGAARDLQCRLLRLLKEHPEDSFAFFGPTGVGKTTLLCALYRHALRTQLRACWYVQMPRLLADLRGLELGTEREPCLSRRMVQDAALDRLRPRVFIDEFDKVHVTDFALNAVGELIDQLYALSGREGRGVQLVTVTNLTRTEFIGVWGNHILRRIEAVCRVLDFFEAER